MIIRDCTTQLYYMGIAIDYYKDPYKTTSIMESTSFFFRGSIIYIHIHIQVYIYRYKDAHTYVYLFIDIF